MRFRLSICAALVAAAAAAEEPPYTVNATVRSAIETNASEWLIIADLSSPSVATGAVHVGYGLLCESSWRDGDQFAVAEVYTQTVSYLEARLIYTPAPGSTNAAPRVGGPTPGVAIIFEAIGTNSVPLPGVPGVGAPSDWLRWTTLNIAIRRLLAAIAAGGTGSTNGVPGPQGPSGTNGNTFMVSRWVGGSTNWIGVQSDDGSQTNWLFMSWRLP